MFIAYFPTERKLYRKQYHNEKKSFILFLWTIKLEIKNFFSTYSL